MMRWWPPLLHLSVLVVLVMLAALRLDGLREGAGMPVAEAAGAGTEGQAAGAEVAPVLPAPAPVDLAALAARPLFVAGRQGAVATPTAAERPGAAPMPERLRMVGYLDDGSKPRAILSAGEGQPEASVRVGDAFAGYEVRAVGRDSVVLGTLDKEITIKLYGQ